MSIWRKEGSTHYERDDKGRVTRVERIGSHAEHEARELEREYRKRHPTRLQSLGRNIKSGLNGRATDRAVLRAKEKEARRTAYEAGRVERAKARGFERGRGPRPLQQPRIVHTGGGRRRSGSYRHSRRRQQSVPVHIPQAPQGEYRLNMWTGRQEWIPYRRR